MSHADRTGGRRRGRPARLAFDYRLSEDVGLGGGAWVRHIERWNVTVADGGGERVGYVQVIMLNLDEDVEIGDLTDAATGAWREPAAAAVRELRRPRAASADGGSGVLGEHILVLDRVFVEPDHRGSGLGPIVAALVVGRLRRGCRLAVCFPAPFDGPRPDDERDRSIAALGRIWASVGFEPRPDGVWVLDLEGDRLQLATEALLAATRAG